MNIKEQSFSPDRIVREKECKQLTGLARTTRYMMERAGKFPSRRQLGGRSMGWMLSEVMEWLSSRTKITSDKRIEVNHA
jgi:prophage regulatory protein